MWRVAFKIRGCSFYLFCIVAACALASCSGGKEKRQHVSIDTLLSARQEFRGVSLSVEGCLKSNPHGLTIGKCASSELGIPVMFSASAEREIGSTLLGEAVKTEIEEKHRLVVTLCGTYSETADGNDRWLEVDSFSIRGRSDGERSTCVPESGR